MGGFELGPRPTRLKRRRILIALLRSTKNTPCLREIEIDLLCFSMLGSHDDDIGNFFLPTVKKRLFKSWISAYSRTFTNRKKIKLPSFKGFFCYFRNYSRFFMSLSAF
jgi:hypothetical protein